jgi:hypothetical protein
VLSPESLAWSVDSKVLYALAEDAGQQRLFAADIKTGNVRALTGDGHVGAVDMAGRALVVSRDSLGSPAQIFEIVGEHAERALTHVGENTLSQTPMSGYEPFTFAGWNDETVQGYVVKPVDFQAGHQYPVAFLIHGGPHGSFGNAWSYRWNPQVWSGMGYAVVMIDFHGSAGFGEAFAKSVVGHWGDRPLVDLQKPVPRRNACLRPGGILRRLHGGVDRRELAQAVEMPRGPRRGFRHPSHVVLDGHPGLSAGSKHRGDLGRPGVRGTLQSDRSRCRLDGSHPGRSWRAR